MPERFATEVQTGLVGIDPLSTILLSVPLLSAENAHHIVSVGVVAWVIVPPLLLILIVSIVILLSKILMVLLASVLLILREKLLLTVLGDSLDTIFFLLLLDSLNPGCASGLVL
jgi:hypothetical protein